MMNKEKKDFIIKRGILGTGLPVALLMSLTAGFQVPGSLFKLQSFNWGTFLTSLLVFTPIFLITGFFWGTIVYRYTCKK
jgi:hypothetical protein